MFNNSVGDIEIANVLMRATKSLISSSTSELCSICMNTFNNNAVKLPECEGHFFHEKCAMEMLRAGGRCAICAHFYITLEGNQPQNGNMCVKRSPYPQLAGFEGFNCIIITYYFPSGIQDESMPAPGLCYK